MTPPPVVRALNGVNAIAYRRVSTEQQASTDKSSLADQRVAIEAKAAILGVVIGEWFEDAGFSGSTVEKRPALLSLIASCEAQPRPKSSPGLIIALNDSRWGRFADPEESGYWRYHLARVGWTVRFAEGDDISDGFARSIVRLAGAGQASEYRRNIIANTIRGSRSTTMAGWWKGGGAPFGYLRKVCFPPGREQRILPHGVRKAADERVMLWPEETSEAPFLRRLFELYADEQHGLVGLAEIANAEYPARSWDSGSLFYMLSNRIYLGHLRSKKASTPEPYGKDGAHPALVSVELFERVAARLKANKRVRRGANREYVLTGLIQCSSCGFPLVGSGGNDRGLSFYRCRGTCAVDNPCHLRGSIVASHRLERAMRDVLAGEFGRAESRAATRRYIDAFLDARDVPQAEPQTDGIDATITRLEQQIRRLVLAIANATLTESEVAPQMREARAKLQQAQEQRAAVLRLSDRRAAAPVDRQRIYAMVDNMATLFRSLTGQDFRGAVLPWLRSATFSRDEKRLTVEIRRVPALDAGWITPDPLSQLEHKATFPDYVKRTVDLSRSARSTRGKR